MYPHDLHAFGFSVSVWNTMFFVAAAVGYFVLRMSASAEPAFDHLPLRYLVTVYLSALAAQLFAYAFDVNTSLTPPSGVSAAAYYLSPVAGPKTLYGVIVLLPVTVAVATARTRLSLGRALNLWTPALLAVLATARAGCLLQGCCYGARSDVLGVSFAVGSPVYYEQLRAGLIAEGSPSLRVFPTQAIEALFLALVAAWSLRRVARARAGGVFVPAIAAYSVFRFVLEFGRADVERGSYGPLSTSQWIAALVLAAALAAYRIGASPSEARA